MSNINSKDSIEHSLAGHGLASHWALDHVGIAVRCLVQGKRLYSLLYQARELCYERLEDQGVELCFLPAGAGILAAGAGILAAGAGTLAAGAGATSPCIELLAPLDGVENKAAARLRKFLDVRGEGLHHICFSVPSVADELKRLAAEGFELIDKKPRAGARNSEIAFLHPKSCGGVLIELCSYREK